MSNTSYKTKYTKFYSSTAWKKTRESYMCSVHRLCEACSLEGNIQIATQVHHKIKVNDSNVDKPEIVLNHKNLVALCNFHHEEIHGKHIAAIRKGLMFDDKGNIVIDPFSDEGFM